MALDDTLRSNKYRNQLVMTEARKELRDWRSSFNTLVYIYVYTPHICPYTRYLCTYTPRSIRSTRNFSIISTCSDNNSNMYRWWWCKVNTLTIMTMMLSNSPVVTDSISSSIIYIYMILRIFFLVTFLTVRPWCWKYVLPKALGFFIECSSNENNICSEGLLIKNLWKIYI